MGGNPYLAGYDEGGVWWESAACMTADPDLFLIPDGTMPREKRRLEATAKETCARCPVIDQCLAEALRRGEQYGVWGGLNAKERRALKAV
jgi:WhiB family redox-sensing transcriptional regulator